MFRGTTVSYSKTILADQVLIYGITHTKGVWMILSTRSFNVENQKIISSFRQHNIKTKEGILGTLIGNAIEIGSKNLILYAIQKQKMVWDVFYFRIHHITVLVS